MWIRSLNGCLAKERDVNSDLQIRDVVKPGSPEDFFLPNDLLSEVSHYGQFESLALVGSVTGIYEYPKPNDQEGEKNKQINNSNERCQRA